jgi:hypothetical protein
MVSAFAVQYGKSYNIDVAVKNTDGTYLPYGSVCNVTTPTFPTTSLQDSQCDGYVVPNANTQIYANSYPGATKYVFLITGAGLPAEGYTLIQNLRGFTLNQVPGWLPTNVYTVKVRMVFNDSDPAGPFGKGCTIIAPGLARTSTDQSLVKAFDAVAYPNPFDNAFEVKVTSPSDKTVEVKVYDMTGRLIETRQGKESDISLGENYPSGVYNLVISQGDQTRTLRVIRR